MLGFKGVGENIIAPNKESPIDTRKQVSFVDSGRKKSLSV